ncbi:MAG TPA: hypothetical protein VGF98_02810 [Candidatus Tumulicola sp.]
MAKARFGAQIQELGEPAFKLENFSLWIRGWETDWTDNWIDITAHFSSLASSTLIAGTFALADDLYAGLIQFEDLHKSLKGKAVFESTEPGFKIELTAGLRGQLEFELTMSPGYWEEYRYETEIDQSYLPAAIEQLKTIAQTYPPSKRES